MRRLAANTAALGLGVAAVLALASCGGGGEESHLLPGETAQQITENVASVRELAAAGECVSARDAAQEVGNQIEALSGIDAKLKQALEEGAEKLNEVVLTCDEEPEEEEELEEAEPPEEEETPKKPEKPKPGKKKEIEPPAHEPEPEEVPKNEQTPPKGEAKGHEEGPAPPEPTEPPSGGIGPGSEAGGQG